jgi:pimeloyl-ACP methyl ester carboxylesterase
MDYPKQMAPFVPELEVKRIEAGHWLQLERPDEVNECLHDFIKGTMN